MPVARPAKKEDYFKSGLEKFAGYIKRMHNKGGYQIMSRILHSFSPEIWLIAGIVLFIFGAVLAARLLILNAKEREREKPIRAKKLSRHGLGVGIYASSIIGNRKSQQDYCLIPDAAIPADTLRDKGSLALVCDGMGGMQGGEKASRCCAELLNASFYSDEYESPAAFFAAEIPKADAAVAALCAPDGSPLGGGTTLVGAVVKKGRVYCCSVGDSRIYLFRDNDIILLTRDHNYFLTLSEKVREGDITMEDALAHPQREALISFVGMNPPGIIDIDKEGFPAENGDIILLCSDGLTKAMSREEIRQVIADNAGNPTALPQLLTSAAFSKGWIRHDNITVAIISCAS